MTVKFENFKEMIKNKKINLQGSKKTKFSAGTLSKFKDKARIRYQRHANKKLDYWKEQYDKALEKYEQATESNTLSESILNNYQANLNWCQNRVNKWQKKVNILSIENIEEFEFDIEDIRKYYPDLTDKELKNLSSYYDKDKQAFVFGDDKFNVNVSDEEKKDFFEKVLNKFNEVEKSNYMDYARALEDYGVFTCGEDFIRKFASLNDNNRDAICQGLFTIGLTIGKKIKKLLKLSEEKKQEYLKENELDEFSKYMNQMIEEQKQAKVAKEQENTQVIFDNQEENQKDDVQQENVEEQELKQENQSIEQDIQNPENLQEQINSDIQEKEQKDGLEKQQEEVAKQVALQQKQDAEDVEKIRLLTPEERNQRKLEIDKERENLRYYLAEERRKNSEKSQTLFAWNGANLTNISDENILADIEANIDRSNENKYVDLISKLDREEKLISKVEENEAKEKREEEINKRYEESEKEKKIAFVEGLLYGEEELSKMTDEDKITYYENYMNRKSNTSVKPVETVNPTEPKVEVETEMQEKEVELPSFTEEEQEQLVNKATDMQVQDLMNSYGVTEEQARAAVNNPVIMQAITNDPIIGQAPSMENTEVKTK